MKFAKVTNNVLQLANRKKRIRKKKAEQDWKQPVASDGEGSDSAVEMFDTEDAQGKRDAEDYET